MPATRDVSAELIESIKSVSSSLTACLKIEPVGGAPFGFTALDQDVTFDSLVYHADPGLGATEMVSVLTYAVDNLEVAGALSDELVTQDDVIAGYYDDAVYTIFLIDYEAPQYGDMILQKGTLGRADILDEKFTFSLRSQSQKLQQVVGELTKPICRADIFDSRCKLNAAGNHPTLGIPYTYANKTVSQVLSRFSFKVVISGVTIPAGYFETGLLVWGAGSNNLQKSEVKTHTVSGTTHTITLQEPARSAFTVGDVLTVRKGCKKRLADCFDVLNVVNRRAEDYLPGYIETLRRP